MFGLLRKEVDISLVQRKYKDKRQKLLALLEEDLKLIDKERGIIKEAFTALKRSKQPDKKHLAVIKKRLDLVHAHLLAADRIAGEETSHLPAETTTLHQLEETVERIFGLIKQSREGEGKK